MAKKHDDYAAAREAVIDANRAVDDAIAEHGVVIPGADGQPDRGVRLPGGDDPVHEEIAAALVAQAEAGAALRRAEVAVAAQVDEAWDRNRSAVQETREAVIGALRNQAATENACGLAARARAARTGTLPQLAPDEQAQVSAARARVHEAREAHETAKATFKSGVTVEQILEAS